jgi:hypothetical protein
MQDLKEFLVTAFCIVSMVLTMLKLVLIELEDLKKRWRK